MYIDGEEDEPIQDENEFMDRVEVLTDKLSQLLGTENHCGVCVYSLLNALANEIQTMVDDCNQDRDEIIKQAKEDLDEMLVFTAEQSVAKKKKRLN